MAQPPPQFRPAGPGVPPPGGPGGPPPGPPGHQGPPGPPGAPGMTRGGLPMPGSRPGSYDPQPMMPYPPPPVEGSTKKSKKGKKKYDSSDSEEEEACKCPPPPPSTQIFICPPGSQPPMGMGMGGQQGMFGQDLMGASPGGMGMGMPTSQEQNHNFIDPAKLCQIQCYGGNKSQDTRTQVLCCPPSGCNGCQKKSQKGPKCQGVCQACGQDCPPRKSKKAQAGTMENMMPASQQFLMFLQAYGLAAALIRDRNKREEDRQQREFEENQKHKRSSSASRDRKGSDKKKDKKGKHH